MSKTAIKIKDLSKDFGTNKILKNINLEIKKGEIYGLIGVSGSGKSTLLNIITGIIPQNNGEVYYNLGKDDKLCELSEKSEEIKKIFGYSFQRPAFHSMLTVQENLEHFATLYGISNKFGRKNANSLLELVELKNAKNVLGKDLSGGMQKRLCFACALIHSPKILFLDEPTANLDPILRRNTINLLKRINENGTTIVISSQLLRELEGFCDRLCIIDKGEIIKEGTIDEIKKEYTSDIEIHLELLSGNYDKLVNSLKKEGISVHKIRYEGRKIVLYTPEAEKMLHNILHAIEKNKETLLDIDLNKPTISEVFESLVKNE